jgi:hypothetical protein
MLAGEITPNKKQVFIELMKAQYVQDSITFHPYYHELPDSADERPDHLKGPEVRHEDPDLGLAILRKWYKLEDVPEEEKPAYFKIICSNVVSVTKTVFPNESEELTHWRVMSVLQNIGTRYWLRTTPLIYSKEAFSQVAHHGVAVIDRTTKSVEDINASVKLVCNNAFSRINIDRRLVLEGINVIEDTVELLTEYVVAKKFIRNDVLDSERIKPTLSTHPAVSPLVAPGIGKRRAGQTTDRLGMMGYRSTDLTFQQLGNKMPPVKKAKIEFNPNRDYEMMNRELKREICAVSPGMQVIGFAAPKPDTNHAFSALEGLQKRLMGHTFAPKTDFYMELKDYTKSIFDSLKWGEKVLESDKIIPLLTDFNHYIEQTNYSGKLKEHFKAVRKEVEETCVSLDENQFEKWVEVKCFVKEESYDEPKFHRGIYARSDYFKVIFGPLVKAMETVVFSSKFFIKKIPVTNRHEWLLQTLYMDGGRYASMDFTGFEKHSIPKLVNSTVHTVYDNFAKYFSVLLNDNQGALLGFCARVLRNMNKFLFKYFTVWFVGGKCSGEMDTSLSNGLLNFILMVYIMEKEGFHSGFGVLRSVRRPGCYEGILPCCFEGDDGNICFPHGLDISDLTPDLFRGYGLDLKIDMALKAGEAGFVCLYFSETDVQLITNPFKHIARMWVSKKYVGARLSKLKSLMRMKCICLLYQFPNCPILGAFCEMILRLTRGHDIRHLYTHLDLYDKERYKFLVDGTELPVKRGDINISTRLTMENVFGASPEIQKQMEAYFDAQQEWKMFLDPPGFPFFANRTWHDNWCNYVMEVNVNNKNFQSDLCKMSIRPPIFAETLDLVHESLLAEDDCKKDVGQLSEWLSDMASISI